MLKLAIDNSLMASLRSMDHDRCQNPKLEPCLRCSSGAKADPSRVRVTDLSEASLDPLARKVRHQLRAQHDIRSSIAMVLSSEKPRCSLIPVSQLSHSPYELQASTP